MTKPNYIVVIKYPMKPEKVLCNSKEEVKQAIHQRIGWTPYEVTSPTGLPVEEFKL